MTADVDLDRRLAAWFVDQAPAHAPDRLLAASMELVGVTSQRPSPWQRVSWRWAGMSRRQRAVISVVLLSLLIGAAALAGALLVQQLVPPGPASILVVRSVGGVAPQGSGVELVAVAGDGRETTVASFTNEQLGGPWSGWQASYSGDGRAALLLDGAPDGQTAIVDLRDPTATPRYPDHAGYGASWGPDGRLAMDGNDGSIVIFDVSTTRTSRMTAPPGTAPIQTVPVPGYTWTADGEGLAAEGDAAFGDDTAPGGVRPAALSTLLVSGQAVAGYRPAFDLGVGPRRVAPDGSRLRCRPEADDSCNFDDAVLYRVGSTVAPVWTEDRPSARVSDFAWAADGGVWVLLEKIVDGPRSVELVHVTLDGVERSVGMFLAGADDPDPNSWSPAGSFTAMDRDDGRLVITTAGDNGSMGQQYLVDPVTGIGQPLDGMVVGWYRPDDLSIARPPVQDVAEAPAQARGDWVRILDSTQGPVSAGAHRISLGRTTAVLDQDAPGTSTIPVAADGPTRLRFSQPDGGLDCPAGSTGTYDWAVSDGNLQLTAVDDACEGRRAILDGVLVPNLPYSGNREAPAQAGTTYVVPELGIGIRIPSTGATVWNHRDAAVSLGHGESDVWALVRVDGPGYDGCGQPLITSGFDGVMLYIDDLEPSGITLVDRAESIVAGRRAITGTLRITSTADAGGICDRWPTHTAGWRAQDADRLTIIDGPGDRVDAILMRGDPRWGAQLTDTLEFLASGS